MSPTWHGVDLWSLTLPTPSIVTIGKFDGVHRGHQALIRQVLERARSTSRLSAVVTFDPPPPVVLRPEVPYLALTDLAERVRLIAALGVDVVAVCPFTRDLAQLPARAFAAALCQRLKMVELWCGPDFAMGRGREGTVPVLRQLGSEMGFTVTTVAPLLVDGAVVSGSRIRALLAEGEVSAAARLLGRYPCVHGRVVPGDQRGRQLGVPTANLAVPPQRLIPRDGIYAVFVRWEAEVRGGVASIGTRPTFGGGPRTVEVHLFDFSGDLYGRDLEVLFAERLRDELAFREVEALVSQMRQDIATARAILARLPWPGPLSAASVPTPASVD